MVFYFSDSLLNFLNTKVLIQGLNEGLKAKRDFHPDVKTNYTVVYK